MIPTLTLCSLDRFCGMVDVYNYIIRVVNILTLFIYFILRFTMIRVVNDSFYFRQCRNFGKNYKEEDCDGHL